MAIAPPGSPSPIAPGSSAPWLVDLEALVPLDARPPSWLATLRPDSNSAPRASRTVLLEDGVPCGEPHRVHADLQLGKPGWSHWERWILFATTDGSDPRANGKRYELSLAFDPSLGIRLLGFGLGPLLMLAPFAGALARLGRSVAARVRSRRALLVGVAAVGGVALGIAAVDPLALSPAGGRERWIVAALLMLAGATVRAARTPVGVRIATRGVAVLLGVLGGTASINAPLAEFARLDGAATLERIAPWLAIGLVALAWFRPSALALLVALVGWRRVAGGELTGFPEVNADWLPLGVAGAALAGGVAAHGWFDAEDGVISRLRRRWGTAAASRIDATTPRILAIVLPLAAALQLGNYLAAAFEKIRVSPRGFDWIVVNHTEHLALIAEALGAARPLHGSAVGVGHDLMLTSRVALNAAIMAIELLPLLAFLRIRYVVATLLGLAAMHAGIFAVTGLCFWKWTLVDLALAAALWRVRSTPPAPWSWKHVLLFTVVSVGWSASPWAIRLGWFDTAALNRVTYQVLLDDGRAIDVPPTFFRCGSYIVACGNFPRLGEEHFPTDTWATTDDAAIRERAEAEALALAPASRFAERAGAAGIAAILRRHHAWALENVDGSGRLAHARWPHHIWSSSSRFGEFDEIDLRRVVAYRLIAESLYLQRGPDGLVESPALRGELLVPLDPGQEPSTTAD